MRHTLLVTLLLTLALIVSGANIMKVSEIKEGMEGIGRTIFKGSKIETFKFKVLGVLENVIAPGRSAIIVELQGPVLAEAGVIAGMSGSPVYINDKIIGAVSFGWGFSKRPIGGVTPIEEILETSDYNTPTYSIDISDIKIDFSQDSINKIKQKFSQEIRRRLTPSPGSKFSRIKLITSSRGINPTALKSLGPLFTATASGQASSKQTQTEVIQKDFNIYPGDAVAIPLIKGDFEYSASGTVTYLDGKNIYMFGHPFFNLGSVGFPLHKASVLTVFPAMDSSFKITATENMIGSVVQDRTAAVQGELGKAPYMIPLKVFLKNRNRKFNIEMIDHSLLTPILAYVSLESILVSEYQEFGFQSIKVKGKIFIENEKNIIIDDLYNGIYSFEDFTGLVLAINSVIMNNKEKKVKIQKMDFEIAGAEMTRNADIENVIVENTTFYADEMIDIDIYLKNERGKSIKERVNVKAPNLKPGSDFYLLVADKNEMFKFDAKNVKSNFFPAKLSSLIRIINNLRKNNRIYVKLITPAKGLFIKGYEYSNLPQSLQNLFSFHTTSNEQSQMRYSTLAEYQMEVPAVVRGQKLFKLKIRER